MKKLKKKVQSLLRRTMESIHVLESPSGTPWSKCISKISWQIDLHNYYMI